MKITVFGAGYVGLVTAACLADAGHELICVDVDESKIANLRQGILPIYEPGLDNIVKAKLADGQLRFSTDPAEGVKFGTLQFIAVGTPPDEDGSADLKYVLAVARTIALHMTEYRVVIDKSTVPVGTADRVSEAIAEVLRERGVDVPFEVCSNPEFLKEGAAVEDFTRGARIVVGTDSERVKKLMSECYAPYNRNHDKLIFMDVRSAELTKYAANAMLATKISFMNEIANLAEVLGADIEHVRHGIGSDPRIGYHFIYPGCGYGGSCFPKDVQALAKTAADLGYPTRMLDAVRDVNDYQKNVLFKKAVDFFGGAEKLKGKKFALWGLAFKPNTDDMRDAPSRILIEDLIAAGATVAAYDPIAMEEAQRIYETKGVLGDGLSLVGTKEAALKDADALFICTEWKAFRAPDFSAMAERMASPTIFDGRNLYDPERLNGLGWKYFAIGRGDSLVRNRV